MVVPLAVTKHYVFLNFEGSFTLTKELPLKSAWHKDEMFEWLKTLIQYGTYYVV